MRINYYKDNKTRRVIIDSIDFCCQSMEDHWRNDVKFDSLYKTAQLRTNLEPGINYCPWCGRRIIVRQETNKEEAADGNG